MGKPLQVLIIEDSEDDTALVVEELKKRGYDPIPQRVETLEQMKKAIQGRRWDIILSNYTMSHFSALQAIRLIRELGIDIPLIIIAGSIGEELAVAAIKAGAQDYMVKDNLSRLTPAIERELEEATRRRKYKRDEVALRRSEERFREFEEGIQEVFWIKDVQKNKMTYMSPSSERIWSRHTQTLYGNLESFIEAIHPEDRPQVVAALKKVPFQSYDLEYRISYPDGATRWIRDRAFPIRNKKGEIYKVSGIAEDTTERKMAVDELRNTCQQLRVLAARLDSDREKDRDWVCREIHDELGQICICIKYDLSYLQNLALKLEDTAGREKSEIEEKIKSALNLIGIAIKSVQKIGSELRPGSLRHLDLPAALEWQGWEFENRTGITCHLNSEFRELRSLRPNRRIMTALFRIFQEILTNIARHAGATQVEVAIKEKADHLLLNVTDNGRGITRSELSNLKSLGIVGMRERARLLGGKIQISRVFPGGTEVILIIPLWSVKKRKEGRDPKVVNF